MEQAIGEVSTFVKFNIDTETRHQELLELISNRSESLDTMSSVGHVHYFVSVVSFDSSDWTKFAECQVIVF